MMAFSTATVVPHYPEALTMKMEAMNNTQLTPLFEATVEAAEEAVVNALVAATTVEGRDGHTAYELPHDRLKAIMKKYGRQQYPER